MYEHYVNRTKFEKAVEVVKLKGGVKRKDESESGKPAPLKLYERLVEERPDLLEKKNEKELVDLIYEGLAGKKMVFKGEEEFAKDKEARAKAMTKRKN